MTIKIGDKIPSVTVKQFVDTRLQRQDTAEALGGKKAVLFGVVGAFTPTCSDDHLPGYVKALDKFKALGIEVFCTSVNDPFVMKEWAKSRDAGGITMLADGNAAFARALGLEMDASGFGMGQRCQRFALYAEDGVVKYLAVEQPGKFDVSGAEAVLAAIKII